MDKRINGTIVSVTRVTPFDKYRLVNGKVCVCYSYVIKVRYSVDGKDYFKKRYWGYCDSESTPMIGEGCLLHIRRRILKKQEFVFPAI